MAQRILGTNPHLRSELQHPAEQIEAQLIDLRQNQPQILRGVDVEIRLILWKLADAGPGPLRRGAHETEDFLELVFVGGAGEERAARVHFRHDAAGRPDVDAGVVGARAEQDVRRAVPERDHFVAERVDGDAERSCQPEIGKLELPFVVDEQVLGLQVAVQDAVFVAEGDAL